MLQPNRLAIPILSKLCSRKVFILFLDPHSLAETFLGKDVFILFNQSVRWDIALMIVRGASTRRAPPFVIK
jgi:hypothetical protein